MSQTITDLIAVSNKLADHDERRENLMHSRDALMRQALAEEETWKTVQDITGLSARGVQVALRRKRP